MSTNHFDDAETELDNFTATDDLIVPETTLSTKLARRRKIEDLFEEKRLKEELDEFI